jgi:hypothetical protein
MSRIYPEVKISDLGESAGDKASSRPAGGLDSEFAQITLTYISTLIVI